MMPDLLIQTIRRHISLSEADAVLLANAVQFRKVRRYQLLVEPPDPVLYEHFIIKGCCRQYYLDGSGVQHTLGFGAEGWWMTDLESFFSGQPAKYYVECLEEGEVLAIKKDVLEELLLRIPELNTYFRVLYQNAIISQNERLLNILSTKADEHYLRFMKKFPELQTRLSQYMIASYLGVTPEFFSRMKARMNTRQ